MKKKNSSEHYSIIRIDARSTAIWQELLTTELPIRFDQLRNVTEDGEMLGNQSHFFFLPQLLARNENKSINPIYYNKVTVITTVKNPSLDLLIL